MLRETGPWCLIGWQHLRRFVLNLFQAAASFPFRGGNFILVSLLDRRNATLCLPSISSQMSVTYNGQYRRHVTKAQCSIQLRAFS